MLNIVNVCEDQEDPDFDGHDFDEPFFGEVNIDDLQDIKQFYSRKN